MRCKVRGQLRNDGEDSTPGRVRLSSSRRSRPMKRLWVVSILTGLALASGMVTTAPLAAAHGVTAIASPSQIEYVGRYTGPATCRVLRVHLNGTQPNTGICLDNQEPMTQGAAPLLSNRNPCNLLDSHIFQDYGEQGALICFYGS